MILKKEDIGIDWTDINRNPFPWRAVVNMLANCHGRLLFSQDGLWCMNLVGCVQNKLSQMFNEIEIIHHLINVQYNEFLRKKKLEILENT